MTESSVNPPEAPLDSWKAIAAHLSRDVRTVRRWEASEGLPVHRHRHLARSSVYAYASELDAWRAGRRPERPAPLDDGQPRRIHAVLLASLATVALASAGDGPLVNQTGPAAQGRGLVVRQVLVGPDVQPVGVPTPDGRFLFTDWSTGDIAIRNPADGETRRITDGGPVPYAQGFGMYPVVSSDGGQVAYTWFNQKSFSFELRVSSLTPAPADAEPRVVFYSEDVRYLRVFAWSPEEKEVLSLVVRGDDTNQIAMIGVPEGSIRVVKSLEWRYPITMSLSPDGRRIAYDAPVRQDAADRDIFVVAADGRQEIPVVQHPAIDYGPVWTPDGNGLVFASDRRGATGLWSIPLRDATPADSPQLVKPDTGNITPLGFSMDRSFFYGVEIGTEDVYVAELNPETAQPSGTPARVTERFTGSNVAGVWSPNGRQFAYVSRRGPLPEAPGSMAVVIRSLDTGRERDLFSILSLNRARPVVRWFPDGRSLLLTASDARGRWHLYRMDTETGATRRVSAGPGLGMPGSAFQPPVLSRDGRTVYYLQVNERTNEPAIQALMTYDLRNGRQRELYRSATHLLVPAVSRDGRQIAFVTSERNNALVLMPATGGMPRELFRAQGGAGQVAANSLAWTHDDRFIVFVRQAPDDGAKGQLWRIPRDGGEPERLSSVEMDGLSFPDISPDGRRLTFSTGRNATLGEIWMMQNVVR